MVLKGADIREVSPSFSFDTSILQLLAESLQKNGEKIAQIEAWTEETVTFSEMLRLSRQIAAGLCDLSVTGGDLVVFCCGKSILAYCALLGTFFTGATAVIIPAQGAADLPKLTQQNPIKVIFCVEFNLEEVKEAASSLTQPPTCVVPLVKNHETMRSFLESTREFQLFQVKDVEKHVPLIMFTSGSTGPPKGVLIPDRSLQRIGYSFDDEDLDSYLLNSTFNWISNPISFISSLLKGYTLVLANCNLPGDILQLIEKYKVNGWTMSSQLLNYFIHEPSLPHRDLSSLTSVIIGGDVVMTRVADNFRKTVLKDRLGVKSLYGMSETGILTTWRNVDLLNTSKTDSCGYIAPGVQVKIVDAKGDEVEVGNVGEVLVKSLSMMRCYWGQNPSQDHTKDHEGFFRTGDAGYLDTDGYLYIQGRISGLGQLKDSKMGISTLEDIIRSHSHILEAVVVLRPNSTSSEDLFIFAKKKANSTVNSEDLLQYLREQIGNPSTGVKEVIFVDSIPKTVNLKIKRKELADLLLNK